MIYRGRNGQNYKTIEPALGKGGEGAVYKIEGMPDYVLKVFDSQRRTETRHRKLLAMLKIQMPSNTMKQVTWPIDVIYDGNQFVGYVMPAVKNCEALNVIYSDKYNFTLAERIGIAKNLCAAIFAVHKAGQVCGDLNPDNIKVDPKQAIVTLIDTDSYHITEPGTSKIYRCEVGLPEYLAKEVQGKMQNGMTLANAPLPTFSKYTDLFALAVHIFALLMNGCHPYACAKNNNVNIGHLSRSQSSVACPQPIANIQNGFFPFIAQSPGLTIPKYAPEFSSLPKEIQDLFSRAFLKGSNTPSERPDTVEWFNALTRMQNNLKRCLKNPRHMYSSHLQQCPWCEVESRMRSTIQPAQTITQTSINLSSAVSSNVTGNNGQHNAPVRVKSGTSSQTYSWSNKSSSLGRKVIRVAAALVILIVLADSIGSLNRKSGDKTSSVNSTVSQAQSSMKSSSGTVTSDAKTSGNAQENTAKSETKEVQYDTIMVPARDSNSITIDKITQNPMSFPNAEVQTYYGNISYEGQEDQYSFTATYDGCYRVDISGIQSENYVILRAFDDLGNRLESASYCKDGDGFTLYDLEAGHTYMITVSHQQGSTGYSLAIGIQRQTYDITGVTIVTDSHSYTDQKNKYTFTIPVSGNYHFEMSGMQSDNYVNMFVYNSLNERVETFTFADNGDGFTCRDLEGGQSYSLVIAQEKGYGEYTFSIGLQKPSVDISEATKVIDSVEYEDQINYYSYTAPEEGRYRFEFSEIYSDKYVNLFIRNSLGETVESYTFCDNGDGITTDQLVKGETYTIEVRQESGFTDYTLSIGIPKVPIDVKRRMIVKDRISFEDQVNVYHYKTIDLGNLNITLSEMNADMACEVFIYDYLGEYVAGDSYVENGKTVQLKDLSAGGKEYEIQVRQRNGSGSYTVTFD